MGCLLWLGAFSLIFIVFFLNLGTIRETLTRTGFADLVRGDDTTEPRQPLSSEPSTAEPEPEPAGTKPQPSGDVVVESDAEAEPESSVETEPEAKPEAKPGMAAKPSAGSEPEAGTGAAAAAKPSTTVPARTRMASLYFVRIDDDGVMARVESKRVVPATDAPLSDAINALLAGPDAKDVAKQLISLVPEGTRLLSARVSGSTATLNFSEAFERSTYGIEGYAGQLKQIVYTATAFPNVTDVRILIEGERRDFLAGESIYIGAPLSRNSF